MSMSLRDQLIQAGLVSEKKARQAEQQQRQHQKQQPKAPKNAPPKPAVSQAQVAKAARDQELNRQHREKAERKARQAEVKQLIEQNRLPKPEGEDYFNFVHGKKIRRILVTPALRGQLTRNEIAIVRCDGKYDFVLPAIADRIRERDEFAVVNLRTAEPDPAAAAGQDDPYKDFAVPDDLMW